MSVKRLRPVPSDIDIAQSAELLPIVEVAKRARTRRGRPRPLRQAQGQDPPRRPRPNQGPAEGPLRRRDRHQPDAARGGQDHYHHRALPGLQRPREAGLYRHPPALHGADLRDQGRGRRRRLFAGRPDGGIQPPPDRRYPRRGRRPQPDGRGHRRPQAPRIPQERESSSGILPGKGRTCLPPARTAASKSSASIRERPRGLLRAEKLRFPYLDIDDQRLLAAGGRRQRFVAAQHRHGAGRAAGRPDPSERV